MDDPEAGGPGSARALIGQLRELINYAETKPVLTHESASFMRDYLGTLLLQNSLVSQKLIADAADFHKAEVAAGRRAPSEAFQNLPDKLTRHIFTFLGAVHLARARQVCQRWNDIGGEEALWKTLCLERCRSLESDRHLWPLIAKDVPRDAAGPWRQMYPLLADHAKFRFRLLKTAKFICNVVGHQISGTPVGDLPGTIVVERRFNLLHLKTFILTDAGMLYLEPEQESDRPGFVNFIEYLTKLGRAGLALDDQRRFIFVPPCEYARSKAKYHGEGLLGVVQLAYPPLAPM